MSPHNHRTDRPRYKDSSGLAVIPTVENQGLSVLQLNADGLTKAKLEVIRQLADSNQVAVVLLQETHRTTVDNLKLPGFLLAGSIPSKHHGMATFVRTGITWSAVKRSPPDSNIEWQVREVQETTIVNVYKPPPSELYPTSLPSVPAPAIYAGDFNCQQTDWGFKQTTKDGETLSDWASSAEAVLLYDPKEPPSLFSARWNTYTNPDLAFAVGRSCDPKPEQRIIDRFPRSHHQPSIIKVPSLVQPIDGKPVIGDGTSGKLTGSYSPQRMKEEHHVSQIHMLMTQTQHTQRIATCLNALRRASHAASTKTTSPDGTTAATISFASTSRQPPRKTSTQRQQHYSIS